MILTIHFLLYKAAKNINFIYEARKNPPNQAPLNPMRNDNKIDFTVISHWELIM